MNDTLRQIWNLSEIAQVPEILGDPGIEAQNLKAVFFENVPYLGKTSGAFAWYGFPEGASAENPAPGIVLVHGGGGTAFADWCRHWLQLGYAVIAMDTCGGTPGGDVTPYYKTRWERHLYSGPAGWGNLDKSMDDPHDQWIYHGVCSVLRAKELLASFPQVQKDNIGVNGISWGAVLSCIAVGIDQSFRYGVPVYGCGGFHTPESSIYQEDVDEKLRNKWFELWDPDHYLTETAVPLFFLAGTGDIAFPVGKWSASTALPKGKVYRSLRPDYPHNHVVSRESKTLLDFVRTFTAGGMLPEFLSVKKRDKQLIGTFDNGGRKIVSAKIFYTRAAGAWMDRRWSSKDAVIENNSISADIPPLTTVCYLGMTDDRGSFWSSSLIEL